MSSKGLNITIYDDNGQKQIVHDINASSGIIASETEQEDVDLNNLDVYAAPGMNISAQVTDAISSYLEVTILSLIASGTNDILNKLGINAETVDIAQNVLNTIDNTIFKINSIIKFIPSNIYMAPSANTAINTICTSLKDMFNALYMSVENKYYETINDAITNLPNTLEMLKDAQDALLTAAEILLREECVKYTGYTIQELYYMCKPLIAKYKAWKESKKKQRQEESTEILENNITTVKGTSIKTNISVDPTILKGQLNIELIQASDLLYNSFFIVLILDAINNLKMIISQFNNIDLNVLVDSVNSLDDLMTMLDEMGIQNKSSIITLSDAISQGINRYSNNLNGLLDLIKMQAESTAVNMITAAIQSTNVSFDTETDFEFETDLTNNKMILNIYTANITDKIQKKITDILNKSVNSEGKRIFSATSVVTVLNTIKKTVSKSEDTSIYLFEFTLDIKYKLNKAKTKSSTSDENISINYELGIITEEYTKNPEKATKRPTFALIHELYGVLEEVVPLFKTFAKLVLNYKTNKLMAENMSNENIYGLIKVVAKVAGLVKELSLDKQNFYTVRSLSLYNYIIQNILNGNTTNETEIHLDIYKTVLLYDYLKKNNLNYKGIDLKLETVLYIDYSSLKILLMENDLQILKASKYFGDDAALFVKYNDSKYKDGTTIGIDKIEIAGNKVYYSDSSLPLSGSQILNRYKLE